MSRSREVSSILVLLVGAWASEVYAQQEPSVLRGVQFLRGRTAQSKVGETAMIALALIKAEVPPSDPALAGCIQRILTRFSGSLYNPERSGGADIYEAAVVAMALVNLDPVAHRSEIESTANFLMGRQNANGSWDYNGRSAGDCSISQYALLGLWEAENAGVSVPPSVWDRAAGFYMSVQSSGGSWNYHRDEAAYPETLSMTAAGVGSLLLCDRQLKQYRHATEAPNPLLTPLAVDGQQQKAKFDATHSAAAIDQAVKRGIAWLGRMFVLDQPQIVGRSPYYGLYGLERIGALADKETIGGVNWFAEGRKYIDRTQKANGSWNADYGEEVNTAYAILFSTKATQRSIRKFEIRRLGAGTLLGGRGLPKDLTSVTVAQGRMVVRPMNGAVEGMLKVLEDPRAENADAALAGLVDRYQERGSALLRPLKDRFRKLLSDPDVGVRRVAVWGLGRTGDLDVVPALVATMRHPLEDDSVVLEARTSLQFLSRKIDGYGPAVPSTPEQRNEAAQKWLSWYNAIRPLDQAPLDDIGFLAPAPAAAASPPAPEAPATPTRSDQR
jgi:HEAT repeats